MLKLNWKTWLALLGGILLVFSGLFVMVRAQGELALAYWLGLIGAAFATGWTCFGLIRWREVSWVKRVNTLVVATLGFGLAVLLFLAVDWEPGYITTGYCYLGVLGFLLGIEALRLVLRPGHPVLGVARTMVEESLRMGVGLIFMIALLVLLPMLPLIFGSEDRVTYMVQRFLTYSNMVVAVLLGMMTILLAARTVSLEIATRQIHMTLTKPLGRAQYLLGKWLGIVLLNAVLLVVAGIGTYGFTTAIANNPALNDLDRYAVDREVLTARLAKTPDPVDTTWERMYINVLQEKQQSDPGRFGAKGDAFAVLADDAKQEVIADTVSRFYSVKAGLSQDFVITGLGAAATAAKQAQTEGRDLLIDEVGLNADQAQAYIDTLLGRPTELDAQAVANVSADLHDRVMRLLEREVIQLSLTPAVNPKPDNQNTEVFLKVNGQPWPTPPTPTAAAPRTRLVTEIPNELPLPAHLINSEGQMVLTITLPETREDGIEQQVIRFNYKDAVIEVFYRVGTFEGNLAKALIIVWLKLAFLAMVGLVVGSLLSFPVAAMFGLIVYVAAAASGVISESLHSYAGFTNADSTWQVITGTFFSVFESVGSGDIYDAFKLLLRLIGEAFMLLIPSFGDFNTHQPLSEGHVITNATLFNAIWKIGLLWTGIVAAIGLFLFNQKEIARVQV